MTQVRNTQNQTGTKPIVIEEKTTTISRIKPKTVYECREYPEVD
ncbi:MAG: hypothetical protein WCF06_09370 [Nitrososphaeraceae archaeon]